MRLTVDAGIHAGAGSRDADIYKLLALSIKLESKTSDPPFDAREDELRLCKCASLTPKTRLSPSSTATKHTGEIQLCKNIAFDHMVDSSQSYKDTTPATEMKANSTSKIVVDPTRHDPT